MVLPKIHQRFLKLFGATFFKPEKMANIMESTRQKTFTQLRTLLSVAAVLTFILVIYPNHFAYGQNKFVRVIDADPVKVENKGKTSIVRLVDSLTPETSKMKNGVVGILGLIYTKNRTDLSLNNFSERTCSSDNRYGRIFDVDCFNGANTNLEMVFVS